MKYHILIVEDNSTHRNIMNQILSEIGMKVTSAEQWIYGTFETFHQPTRV